MGIVKTCETPVLKRKNRPVLGLSLTVRFCTVKHEVDEKVNAAVREYLTTEFGMSEEDTERMMTALIQFKIPYTSINHTRTNFIKEEPFDHRHRGRKNY